MIDTHMSAYANPDMLVSTEWLVENLDDPDIRIIQVCFEPFC